MWGVQEQGWGQLDPTLCIRLLYSPRVSLEWNYVLDFPPRLVLLIVSISRELGLWRYPSEKTKSGLQCVVSSSGYTNWSSPDHRFLMPGTAAGDDPFPVLLCSLHPAGDSHSHLCSMHAWNCVHILNSVGDEHRNSGCLMKWILASLIPKKKYCQRWPWRIILFCFPSSTPALLGLGSVFIPKVESQGMKLSEKNQGSPAGELWSLVRVSWLGYGWL